MHGVEWVDEPARLAIYADYAGRASALHAAIDANFWDAAGGAYRQYPTSAILPQDGNALAVWYGLADRAKAQSISAVLRGNWNDRGTTSPENKGNPGVFAGSENGFIRTEFCFVARRGRNIAGSPRQTRRP